MKRIHKQLGESVHTKCGRSLWKEEDLFLTMKWKYVTCKNCLIHRSKDNCNIK